MQANKKNKTKKKKQEEEEFGDFVVRNAVAAPAEVHAVYFSPDEQDWCYFPVILFTVGDVKIGSGEDAEEERGVVRGMISAHGGLELVEENPDLEFIGYWRKDVQPDIKSFLEDHGIDEPPSAADDEEDDDEDEEDEEEDDEEEDEG